MGARPGRGMAAALLIAAVVLAAPRAAVAEEVYVVEPGDTLSEIARQVAVAMHTLATLNGIGDPDRIVVGQHLALEGAQPPGAAPAVHVVEPGDTLSEIAARYGTTAADLAAANGIGNHDLVRAGVTLTVPGGWQCPVGGAEFVNDFGVAKHDGRFHEGVDLFAPRGTPVVVPVGGELTTTDGPRGGLQFRLDGDDGFVYFGTHLDRLAVGDGHVGPGQVVGDVGTTGNAVGSPPHLHFEMHPPDGPAMNPYPVLQRACGG